MVLRQAWCGVGRDRAPNAGLQGAQVGGPKPGVGDELQQAHAAVELAEGAGSGPSVAAMAEQAIDQRAYASAMNIARIWLLNKPHVERAARSMDPADPFVARAQAVLDRMRPLEPRLPSHPFALGVPELDRKDRDAWLSQLGATPAPAPGPAGSAPSGNADVGASSGHGEGSMRDVVDLEGIARGVLVPFWAQNDTVRRTILGADQNPVMDGVDDVAHSLIYDSVYGAGFAVGAARGCGSAVVDCLRGPYDLAKLAIEVGTKLALFQHTELLTSLRDTIKAVPAAIDLLGKRWNDDSDRRAQGAFQGEVVGYIGTQLAILVITAAANPLAELAGPYAAVIRAIAAVGDPLSAIREVALGVRLSEEATAALRVVRRGARTEAAASDAVALDSVGGRSHADDLAPELTASEDARGIAVNAEAGTPAMTKRNVSLDGHTVESNFAGMSDKARHVVRQLEGRGWMRVSEIHPDELAEVSRWFGVEIAVVQAPYGKLRVVLGHQTGILVDDILPGEVFIMHTHPVMVTKTEHFGRDLQVAGKHVEAVVDWSGQVTYFSKAGLKNASRLDGTVEPLVGYQAAFMNQDGSIIGFAKIDIIDGPNGATVKVRE